MSENKKVIQDQEVVETAENQSLELEKQYNKYFWSVGKFDVQKLLYKNTKGSEPYNPELLKKAIGSLKEEYKSVDGDGNYILDQRYIKRLESLAAVTVSLDQNKAIKGTFKSLVKKGGVPGLSFYYGDVEIWVPYFYVSEDDGTDAYSDKLTQKQTLDEEAAKEISRIISTKLNSTTYVIVKDIHFINNEDGLTSIVAVASRKDALRIRKEYGYFKKFQYQIGGNIVERPMIFEGVTVQANIINSLPSGIFVEVMGVEKFIPSENLGATYVKNARFFYDPGDTVTLAINEIVLNEKKLEVDFDAKSPEKLKPNEDIKTFVNPGEKYVGYVTGLNESNVFVECDLDGTSAFKSAPSDLKIKMKRSFTVLCARPVEYNVVRDIGSKVIVNITEVKEGVGYFGTIVRAFDKIF